MHAVEIVLTLALGMGATIAIFSVADAVLLRPLPWPDADRLVAIYSVLPDQRNNRAARSTWNRSPVTWPTWMQLRAVPAFEVTGAWTADEFIVGEARTDIVPVIHASSAFLPMLGVS